jgi:hypothetical protein
MAKDKDIEITYAGIKPYILEETFTNANAACKFQIEDEIYEAAGSVRVDTKNSGTHNIKNMARNSIIGRIRSSLSSIIYKVTGGGLLGNVASMAGNESIRQNVSTTSFSRADQEKAVVDAFKKIIQHLYFDEEKGAWRVARIFSDFERRLKANPITKAYDKKTLARMLIEMSRADGQMEDSEREFLSGFLSAETGTLVDLMRRPPISRVECEEVTKEGRENVFMIVAAMAISDYEFEEAEKVKLAEYGEMMGFTADKQAEILRIAQNYTIEAFIREGSELSRDEIYKFGESIGMERTEAERAQVRFDKRIN